MIEYTNSLEGVTAGRLRGFFVGWPDPPSPETYVRLFVGSDYVELALDA